MPGSMTGIEDTKRVNNFKAPVRKPAYAEDDTSGLYSDVDPVIGDMISGKGFDPVEMQMQAAMGRMERTGRARSARGISGMAGQGIGGQMAGDVEADMAGTRLQGLLSIGTGRQEMKERGVATRMARIGQQEEIRMGRERLNLSKLDQKQRYELASRAQDIQNRLNEGQLSLREAEFEAQKMMNEFNKSMGREQLRLSQRASDRADFPVKLQRSMIDRGERSKEYLPGRKQSLDLPHF